ncbi:unnamed protein product [Spirodela intermedia]|uniref:Uncharacterized protein n=1 Tax=Spirodela intermedia TaxID=51605 RepID=A0A7I8II75_SPIIN|nr:unnamed protein product [Spirodela intermedia]CAA6657583.1 unnamed protein product [Spirodela intermedia]
MDFRDWCEGELVRLTGAKDTSFLEFCMKQSTSEAKTLLRENLGSLDRDHAFIDKLLNYKELLPADVIEIAFQPLPSHSAAPRRSAPTPSRRRRQTTPTPISTAQPRAAEGRRRARKGRR